MKGTRPFATTKILVVLLLPALLFLSSCDFNKSESEKGFENPLAQIGKIHNQGLDHALGDLKETDIREIDMIEKSGRNVISNVVETSTRTFLQERDLGGESIEAMKVGMSVVRSMRSNNLRKSQPDGEAKEVYP